MRKDERYQVAESLGLIANIGCAVETALSNISLIDETSVIIGWFMMPVVRDPKCQRPMYVIRGKNSECKIIPTTEPFRRSEERLVMSGYDRYWAVKTLGLIEDIGKTVTSVHPYAFRTGDTAEIVGWYMVPRLNVPELTRPMYVIRFENGECDMIPAGELFEHSGFIFAD